VKRVIRWSLIAAATGALLLGGLLLLIQTETAKTVLAARLSSLLGSGPERRITLEGLRGRLPFELTLTRCSVADQEGTWLELEDLQFEWSPWDLLGGTVRIQQLGAKTVTLTRPPRSSEPQEPQERPGKPLEFPGYLRALRLQRMEIQQLVLGRQLLGQSAVLAVTGSLTGGSGATPNTAELNILRTDEGPSTRLGARLEWAAEADTLTAAVDLEESPDGLLAALARLPDAGALRLTLTGNGPPRNWQGELDAQAERFGRVRSAIQVDLGERRELALDGSLQLGSKLLPGPWAAVCDGSVRFRLKGSSDDFDRFVVTALSLEGAGQRFELSGETSLGAEAFQVEFSLRLDDLSRLEPVLNGGVSGRAEITGALAGSFDQPAGDLALHLDHLVYQGTRLTALDLRTTATALAGSRLARPRYRIDGDGRAEIDRIPGIDPLPERELEWNLAAQFTEDLRLDLDALRVSGRHFAVEAVAALDFARRNLDASARVDIPDLKAVQELVAQPLAGRLSVTAAASGPWDRFQANLDLSGQGVAVGTMNFDRLRIRLSAGDLPQRPRGDLGVEIERAGDRLEAATDYHFEPGLLGLTHLKISAPQSDLHGDLRMDLKNRLLDGNLAGNITDLSGLGRILGRRLQGNVVLNAGLNRDNGRQQVVVRAQGRGLQADQARLRQFSLSADFQDLYRQPRGQADLSAAGFDLEPLQVDTATVKLRGDRRALEFASRMGGRLRDPFALEANGRLTLTDQRQRLDLTKLEGRYGKLPFKLSAPTAIDRGGPSEVALSPLELRLGQGRVSGSARLRQQQAAAEIRVSNLDLALLHDFGLPDLEGQWNLVARLSGSPAAPTLTVETRADRLRITRHGLEQLPPAALEVDGKIAAGRLTATARLSGIAAQPLLARGSVPLTLSLRPGRFEVSRTNEVQAGLQGELQLEPLAALFLPEQQLVAGSLETDLAVGGSIASPRFSGGAKLRNGRYENLDAGTVLSRITGDLAIENDRLVIRKLEGAAGSGGTLTAQGAIDLVPARHFPLALDVQLNQAKLVHSDQLDATAAGNLQLKGDLQAMELTGELALAPVEARIPETSGHDLPQLRVIEINKPGGRERPEAKAATATAFHLGLQLLLDLPNRVFVRGRGLESEWTGRLKVSGTASRPVVVGNLELVRGYLDFMGKRLNLRDSRIQFTGADPPDPLLNIKAESVASDVTARILVTGTAAAPEIRLESAPPLPEDEIMSHLLFGRSAARVSATQAVRIALALRTLAGGGNAMNLLGRTRKLLGVDQLDLRQGEDGEGTRVGVGKYLTDDLYLDLEQGANTGRVRVELEVLPNITIDGEITDKAEAGVGLNWKHDY